MSHWTVTRDQDGIAWLSLDVAGAPANTLSGPVLAELAAVLDRLDAEPPKGLVIVSGKAAGFVAGADFATASEPTWPVAPGRFSMTSCCFRSSLIF